MNKKCSDRDGISAFERKDGRYEARALDTRRFGSDGKRKYKSFYGTIKTDEPRTLDFSGVRGFLVTNVCIVQRSAA